MKKMYKTTAAITGSGRFPIDMLRYDKAFPDTEQEAGLIINTFDYPDPWKIRVATYHTRRLSGVPAFTHGRWESFGCAVEIIDSREAAI
jgi:hypothetical protein